VTMFHFHVVRDGARFADEEGAELPDLESAREEAIEAGRALVAEAFRFGTGLDRGEFHISDSSGVVLLVVPLPSTPGDRR
jgi:hypothetical protein